VSGGWPLSCHLPRSETRRNCGGARRRSPDNVIGIHVAGPDNIETMHPDMIEGGYSEGSHIASQLGRFRPIPELSGYRTVLKNVYCCSSNLHSGSGIGRGSSLNCFQVMCADLGLKQG
jgi:phytoene dehydrogenase-like protein